ncbi:hypothetical protein ACIBL3_40555 [Kribbella sp. NPDC050124]|uniref:hypothetical protein n=1 Tax=Kribbella sp. NPDC050124 TaxID=3364114 RepID=UPI0037A8A8DE
MVVMMTQQYLAGELSQLLAQLRAVATDDDSRRRIGDLRREAESMPLPTLASVAVRALLVADAMCWNSIERGDITAFSRQAAAGAALYEFGTCAGLLDEELGRSTGRLNT